MWLGIYFDGYMYVLQRNMQCKSQVQLMKYMIDVAMGMHYLAEKGILHRVSHNERHFVL